MSNNSSILEAGAVVVNRKTGLVLLVTANGNQDQWLFPKGHVEGIETISQAAVREAREEADINGSLVEYVGCTSYNYKSNEYKVHYYLLLTDDFGSPREGRLIKWCGYDEAMKLLTFPEIRGILELVKDDIWARN